MPDTDAPAEISVGDALKIAQVVREWTAFKRASGGDTQGGVDGVAVQLNAPIGWVRIIDKTSIAGSRYRYTVEVIPSPFAPKLTPAQAALATSQVGYCVTEFGDEPPESDATLILKGAPVLAQLFWTWVESNDPAKGKWAWWFTPGGGTLPTGQYQFQQLSMVAQNQVGWSYAVAHPMVGL